MWRRSARTLPSARAANRGAGGAAYAQRLVARTTIDPPKGNRARGTNAPGWKSVSASIRWRRSRHFRCRLSGPDQRIPSRELTVWTTRCRAHCARSPSGIGRVASPLRAAYSWARSPPYRLASREATPRNPSDAVRKGPPGRARTGRGDATARPATLPRAPSGPAARGLSLSVRPPMWCRYPRPLIPSRPGHEKPAGPPIPGNATPVRRRPTSAGPVASGARTAT